MSKEQQPKPDRKDQRIAELEGQLAEGLTTIEELGEQIEHLQGEIESLKRAGKRQVVLIVRRKRVTKPKNCGRRKARGSFRTERSRKQRM